jgi:hypothetical protein
VLDPGTPTCGSSCSTPDPRTSHGRRGPADRPAQRAGARRQPAVGALPRSSSCVRIWRHSISGVQTPDFTAGSRRARRKDRGRTEQRCDSPLQRQNRSGSWITGSSIQWQDDPLRVLRAKSGIFVRGLEFGVRSAWHLLWEGADHRSARRWKREGKQKPAL